jgi:hypothetical protein
MMALSAAIAVGLAIVSVAVASRGANHAPGMTAPAAHTQPVALPDSHGGWDPYVAAAPDGTLYVSFMITSEHREYPIIEVSRDQGQTFTVESSLRPEQSGNWGDAEYLAVGPEGTLYVAWATDRRSRTYANGARPTGAAGPRATI